MNLHEYQAKALFKEYGLSVPEAVVIERLDQVDAAVKSLGNRVVVKAQVHAGGRGKAGGVKLVDNVTAAREAVRDLLGTRLVTDQTDATGQPVNQILLEAPADIARELYLGAVIDRQKRALVLMASTEGGVDIETVAQHHPEKILKAIVDPLVGLQPCQCREVAFALGLQGQQVKQMTKIMLKLSQLIHDKDLSLLEINPLVVNRAGDLICLDGKINIDSNALYRQPAMSALHDFTQEDAREHHAQQHALNYIALEGSIGCMVNGAGLAMATMDLIKLYGGEPANFLDVGGTATEERVAEAFKIILSDKQVKGVFVNIFGGIVRCDLVAEGIMQAVKQIGVTVPVVVRLAGNNAELATELLAKSGLNITPAQGLAQAAQTIVNQVKKGGV